MTANIRTDFLVVINNELQYSIWPFERAIPCGWTDAGFAGSREDCLAHIDAVWTDMRPASIRGAPHFNSANRKLKD
jgi:MbtH protein